VKCKVSDRYDHMSKHSFNYSYLMINSTFFVGMQGAANAAILASKISVEMATMLEALKLEMAMKLDAAESARVRDLNAAELVRVRDLELLQQKIDTNTEVLKREMHVVGDEMKIEVLIVKDILVNLDSKVEALIDVQLDLNFTMRQAMLDWKTDHVELKSNLFSLGDRLSIEFASLERTKDANTSGISSLTEDDLRGMVQTAVQSAISQITSIPLHESIRQAMLATMKECSAPRNDNSNSDTHQQLQAITAMLLQLKDDVKQVSSEISEVRVDLKAVNRMLGRFVPYNFTIVDTVPTDICLQ
jgi:hypothetical protein